VHAILVTYNYRIACMHWVQGGYPSSFKCKLCFVPKCIAVAELVYLNMAEQIQLYNA